MARSTFTFAPMSETSLAAASAMDRMYRRQRHIYDATRKFYLLGRDALIDRLAPPAGSALLEIGCGTGRNLILAARRHPDVRLFGVDISEEMLATARANVSRAGLSRRVFVARGDAAGFDPAALFGVETFDRVFISYALSMIPPWREAVAGACGLLTSDGSLHIVDFGDQAALPATFRAGLRSWLKLFNVHPRLSMETELGVFAATRGLRLSFQPLYRRYAFLAELKAAA
jgi:S-adenosylmethionine-diacylgycerolhomoserine-N-methlytransferase